MSYRIRVDSEGRSWKECTIHDIGYWTCMYCKKQYCEYCEGKYHRDICGTLAWIDMMGSDSKK